MLRNNKWDIGLKKTEINLRSKQLLVKGFGCCFKKSQKKD